MPFRACVPDVEEETAGPPAAVAAENAYRKAAAVAAGAPGDTVLGVDTVVALGSTLYGKPADEAHARSTLAALGGRVHAVVSAICVIEAGRPRTAAATTQVRLRPLDDRLIAWYLASGEWRGRAGGYAIQGRGAALVAEIAGDYLNVVGLPVAALLELLPGLLGTPPA